jgi:hypothetical protein
MDYLSIGPAGEAERQFLFTSSRPHGLLPHRAASGVAVIEFSLVSVLFATMMMGCFDTSLAFVIMHQAEDAADIIALSATALASSASGTINQLTVLQATQLESMVYPEIPELYNNNGNISQFSMTLSGLSFSSSQTPGTITCSLGQTLSSSGATIVCDTANIAWSTASTSGSLGTLAVSNTRACGTLTQSTAGTGYVASYTTVQTSGMTLLDSGGYLLADVRLVYAPTFLAYISASPTLFYTGIQPMRSISSTQWLAYDVAGEASDTAVCPKYQA